MDPLVGGDVPIFQDNPVDLVVDPHEVQFHEYLYEQWEEEAMSWSPFLSLEQLSRRNDPEIGWYCPNWIPVGAKTIFCAQPKCGKTIALLHMLKAITEGGKFMGNKCEAAKVLYWTEETEHEFKKQVREVPGLLGSPNFFVLLPEEMPTALRTWSDIIAFAGKALAITKAKIVVFDTFLTFARLHMDAENDSAAIQNTINEINPLFKQQRYLSVVLTHHTKKPEEKFKRRGDLNIHDIRGSSAFSGGAGHIILMRDYDDKSTRRNFIFKGRYINDVEIEAYITPEREYRQISYHANH